MQESITFAVQQHDNRAIPSQRHQAVRCVRVHRDADLVQRRRRWHAGWPGYGHHLGWLSRLGPESLSIAGAGLCCVTWIAVVGGGPTPFCQSRHVVVSCPPPLPVPATAAATTSRPTVAIELAASAATAFPPGRLRWGCQRS